MKSERATAMIEVIVLGFATVLLVLPTLVAVARLVDASAMAGSQARDAAMWMARHGTELVSQDQRIDIDTTVEGSIVRSTAHARVTLLSVGGAKVERFIEVSYEVPISRYRSRR
ncbi:hypothetical protein MNBD_ACTINO01-831 [hydrothermal vent metagenome]|uniref:Uncharacterized protein n=1 Tax=hydrothermal vent metagenome TaxID=652676 RepID=A0A3B0T2G4_9ZZZZ